ncbi:DUF2784 domain-containing protein [Natronospira bacteriovora]|uniref:DUF2784 domain-containing protein n=1 Tax=Natronospira bacteriovora TaxID=3069753 RepID=A0ABU0W6F3_9GAMM|nr:DUF2784 domain-containing protein [Natronospira sp. AB-CW4]MDQ2069607.1 DUF2784 domain-containing protein [Natronospira sp. AB-CW4]
MSGSVYQQIPAPALVADGILLLHALIVAFVIVGQLLFMIGGWRGWDWVRRFWLRLTHLGLIAYVTLQAWLGELCPLTVWEHELRRVAGQSPHGQAFLEYWLGRLIYYDLPAWVFLLAYTVFALLVLVTWWWIPPYRRGSV